MAGVQTKLQQIRDNKLFETFVVGVIILSSVAIGIKTYELSSTTQQILVVLDYGVTLFFLVEILIRLAAEPRLADFFKKGWNVFDFTIVVISLIPLDDAEYALLARILRTELGSWWMCWMKSIRKSCMMKAMMRYKFCSGTWTQLSSL